MAFCSNCGASLKQGTKFCDNCGTPAPIAAHEQTIDQTAPAHQAQGGYAPPEQQAQGGYTPPAQQAQSSYTPPVQQAQSSYTPPVQPVQGGYTPPVQQAQSSYTPPAQQAQGGYTPPVQQAQGGYTPPAQQAQSSSYTPPVQQAQGGYVPPTQQQYGAQAAYAAPQATPRQKKPLNKKLLLFGGIGVAAILIVVLIVSLLGGKGDPYAGVWNGVKLETQGMALDVQEVLGGGIVFDIKSDGTCKLTFGPENLSGKWTKEKDGILIKAGAYTLPCTVKGTTMVIENYADSGMTLTLEKEGGKGKPGTASSDPNVGVWKVVYAEMWGMETDISDVFVNGFTIELLDKGKCKLNIDGTKGDGKWTFEDGAITIKGGGLDVSGTLNNGVLVLEDVLGTGLNLKLQKEGAQTGSTGNGGSGGFSLPGSSSPVEEGFQSPTTTIKEDSLWYGTAILSNFTPANRAAEVEGEKDIWAYIGTDNNGRAYFEVFETPDMEETPLLSMYIELYDDSFAADIGDEDAWLLEMYLDDSANVFFSPELENGALSIFYHFKGKNVSFDFTLFLREDGTPWDEENDTLPPGYEDYKAEHGLTGSNSADAGIKIDSSGSTFSIGASSDDYGKDGWVYTKTGSMRMRIPEGWEVANVLAEKTMAVRSAQSGGDSIGIKIDEYFNSTPQEKRTPENQVLLNNSDAKVTKEKWGNTDVWYRIKEWGDYNQISGYAVYDAGNYVAFDIRVQKANGTVEEFMKSAAWKTLTTTFELKTP